METISKTLGMSWRLIGKPKICNDKFPKSLDVNKEEITDKKNYSSNVQYVFYKYRFQSSR